MLCSLVCWRGGRLCLNFNERRPASRGGRAQRICNGAGLRIAAPEGQAAGLCDGGKVRRGRVTSDDAYPRILHGGGDFLIAVVVPDDEASPAMQITGVSGAASAAPIAAGMP